jgi:hypothetical protein
VKNTGKQHTNERDEAERIYRAIFRAPIPSDVRDRYCRATKTLFSGFSPEEEQAFAELLREVSDLEALEIAARQRNKIPQLVHRFQLMVHLAENLPANQRVFVNSFDRRISGFFSLGFGGVRTLYKFMKGYFLLRRAGNV